MQFLVLFQARCRLLCPLPKQMVCWAVCLLSVLHAAQMLTTAGGSRISEAARSWFFQTYTFHTATCSSRKRDIICSPSRVCPDQAKSLWPTLSWGIDVLLGQRPCQEEMAATWRDFTCDGGLQALSSCANGCLKTASKKSTGLFPQLISAPWRKSKKAFNDPSGHNMICIFLLSGQAHSTKTPGAEGESLWKPPAKRDAVRRWREEGWACVMKVGRWRS